MSVSLSVWCEHCRDHYPASHYVEVVRPDGFVHDSHGIGAGFGRYGELLAAEQTLAQQKAEGDA